MNAITLLYHGLPAILRNGFWILLSADLTKLARIPEARIEDEEIFSELVGKNFFSTNFARPNVFQLILITTSNCNLRCRYCFANGGDQCFVMGEALAKASIDFAFSQAEGKRLSIAFFGGEPTLTPHLIKFAVDYSRRMSETNNVDGVEFSITTNGVFPVDFLSYMVRNDFMITLSADGPAEIQNFQRPLKNMQNSSDLVESTIRRLAEAGRRFKIRATVTDNSVDRMSDVVQWVASLGGKQIHFEPVSIAGRATKGELLTKPAPEKFIVNLQKAILAGARVGVGVINSSFMNISNPPPEFCEGDASRRMAVSYTGDVTTCVEVQDPCHPAFNKFVLGGYDQATGKLEFRRSEREKCSGGKFEQCENCFALKICGGGCPVRNFHITGDASRVDPFRCETIKSMLPFVIELFDDASRKV